MIMSFNQAVVKWYCAIIGVHPLPLVLFITLSTPGLPAGCSKLLPAKGAFRVLPASATARTVTAFVAGL
jgi:hypothetical protein